MTQAALSNGTTMTIFGSPIEEILSISGTQWQNGSIDVTSVDASSMELIQGLSEEATISVEMNWTNSTVHKYIRDTALSDAYVVQLPGSPFLSKWTFNAKVESFELVPESGGAIKASFTLKAGPITFA